MTLDWRVVLILAVDAYRNVMFLWIILGWLSMFGAAIPPVLRPAVNFVHDLTEPFFRLFRGLLPAVRTGAMALDLSPILAFIVLYIIGLALRKATHCQVVQAPSPPKLQCG